MLGVTHGPSTTWPAKSDRRRRAAPRTQTCLNALPLSSRPGAVAPSTVDEIVFLGEGDDHLSGAGGVLVDQNDHASVEPPWA